MSCIAIITARGGSKSFPKKNIKDFCGKPIIAYSIEAALKSGIFDEVLVSTDSKEIANTAKQYEVPVLFLRFEDKSNNHASVNAVIKKDMGENVSISRFFEKLGVSFYDGVAIKLFFRDVCCNCFGRCATSRVREEGCFYPIFCV